jgi:hypothetical protein
MPVLVEIDRTTNNISGIHLNNPSTPHTYIAVGRPKFRRWVNRCSLLIAGIEAIFLAGIVAATNPTVAPIGINKFETGLLRLLKVIVIHIL